MYNKTENNFSVQEILCVSLDWKLFFRNIFCCKKSKKISILHNIYICNFSKILCFVKYYMTGSLLIAVCHGTCTSDVSLSGIDISTVGIIIQNIPTVGITIQYIPTRTMLTNSLLVAQMPFDLRLFSK
jgi:hypothetical protein